MSLDYSVTFERAARLLNSVARRERPEVIKTRPSPLIAALPDGELCKLSPRLQEINACAVVLWDYDVPIIDSPKDCVRAMASSPSLYVKDIGWSVWLGEHDNIIT